MKANSHSIINLVYKSGMNVLFLIVLFLLINPFPLFSQIVNGSFENTSGPTLSGWDWTCEAESFQNAPPDGGNWCIKVLAGTSQGICLHGLAYQKIFGVVSGKNYELAGWAYADNTTAGVFFGSINNGEITYYSGGTVSVTDWTRISIESTFKLNEGDTAIVILHSGITVGAPNKPATASWGK